MTNNTLNKFLLALMGFLMMLSPVLAQDGYKSNSRYNYYTTEKEVAIIVWIPESKEDISVTIDIVFEFEHLLKGEPVKAGQMNLFTFPVEGFHMGENELTVSYNEEAKWVGSDKVDITLLPDHFNAVKIDHASGGLIVEGLPFYPFGFYNYSPVQPGLAEEEVVKGFNMMSPYQKIEGKTLKERKAYMDRCAALGMKVNYNVLSVAGGGGVGNKEMEKRSDKNPLETLRKEIEAFKDHPALLSWYISDEPVGQGVSPAYLESSYNLIKELDPYHPVSIVFMTPSMAKDYSHVMDIVMADPYVIPEGNIKEVGKVAADLYNEFYLEKPVWIVPQAFGGNEWWEREPTRQELRAMTYLSLVNNAMGIQYFVRHGLNSFPKSTAAWNECGNIALEVAELTPYLFSPDPVRKISCDNEDIQIKGYHKDGVFMVIAVNTSNKPLAYSFILNDIRYQGSASVLFENRKVAVRDTKVEDMIDAYGSRVYEMRYMMASSKGTKVNSKNQIKDPSFEDISGLGIPASCYARPGTDRGATYFIDSRTSARGSHSLRMTSPNYDGGVSLSLFRTSVERGRSYTMSVQAKSIPLKHREKVKPKFFHKICGCGPDEEDFPEFTMTLGAHCKEYFMPNKEWNEYRFSCIPETVDGTSMISPGLQLTGKGTAWFDLVQLYPDMDVKSFVNRDNNDITIRITTVHKGTEIFYTLDGSEPTQSSTPFKGNFNIHTSAILKAVTFKDGVMVGYIERPFVISMATGRYVEYKYKYSTKYDAGMKDGLVDGILASSDFKDGRWQGFEGDDLDVVINLKEVKKVNEVILRFHSMQASWIFLPVEIKVLWSADGNEYYEFASSKDKADGVPEEVNKYTYRFQNDVEARYIRIFAKNIGACPEGHSGEGGKAWLFTDEIIIQ